MYGKEGEKRKLQSRRIYLNTQVRFSLIIITRAKLSFPYSYCLFSTWAYGVWEVAPHFSGPFGPQTVRQIEHLLSAEPDLALP